MEKEIKAKRIGSNLIVMVGEQKLTKKVTSEEAEKYLAQIAKFNKKPTQKAQDAIVAALAPKTIEVKKEKEKKKGVEKAVKKQLKKAVKKAAPKAKKAVKEKQNLVDDIRKKVEGEGLSADEVQALEDLLKKSKKVEETKPAPVASTTRRSGEH